VAVIKVLVIEMNTTAVVAKVVVRKTNASWSSRAHLSHKTATRTKAFAMERGMVVALEITVMTVVMIQAGKAEEPAVIATAIVVVMFNDCDGFNDDHGVAGISNSDDSDGYDGGVWDCANAAEDAACGGSNSGGSAGSIRVGMSVDSAVRGYSSSYGGDEVRDAAGEALVVGIGVAGGWGVIKAGAGCHEGACDGDEHGGSGFDGDGCIGAGRDGLDGRGSVDDAAEAMRDHTVECGNQIMWLKPLGDHTIEDTNFANDKLCEAVEEVELWHCGRMRRVSSDGYGRRNVMRKERSQQ